MRVEEHVVVEACLPAEEAIVAFTCFAVILCPIHFENSAEQDISPLCAVIPIGQFPR